MPESKHATPEQVATAEKIVTELPAQLSAEEAAALEAYNAKVAEEAAEYGDFAVEVIRTPKPGVSTLPIPLKLAEYLALNSQRALKEPDYEMTITAKDKVAAIKLVAHARNWGSQQTPELYIHKLPNRRDMPDNVARLAVELESEVKPENRPGRKK